MFRSHQRTHHKKLERNFLRPTPVNVDECLEGMMEKLDSEEYLLVPPALKNNLWSLRILGIDCKYWFDGPKKTLLPQH